MGSRDVETAGMDVTVRAWLAGLVRLRVEVGAGHLVAWVGKLDGL